MDGKMFEQRFTEHRRALERFVRWRIENRADADDVLQDTLLSAWTHREMLKSVEAFKPWLLQIARNACNEYYRRSGRQPNTVPLDDCVASLFTPSSERNLLVCDAVERLPANSAEVLRLTYFDDLPQAEIARLLNIPPGTVKSRLHTAKRQFRENYENY